MREPLFIGVDGGGSRTRARLRDAAGTKLGEGLAGPGNFRLGLAAFEEVMKACRAALAEAGLAEVDAHRVHAGFGLAGAAPEKHRREALGWPHPFGLLDVCSDAYASWLGAFGGADGAILIAGTGSCGLSFTDGRATEVGGLGSEIGDEGSGMAIGRTAIRRALWALERYGPMTPLAEAVLADPRIGHDRERAVIWANTARPRDFADFAPLVFDHAERGDPLGSAIIAEAASDLTRLARRLLELGPPPIAMVGSVFDRIRPWIDRDIDAVLVKPPGDAADGAIILARRALERSGHLAEAG
ncbi:MAG: BadF/BadG/BcrA/BcrD ATPase family protein [Bauldia sp.]